MHKTGPGQLHQIPRLNIEQTLGGWWEQKKVTNSDNGVLKIPKTEMLRHFYGGSKEWRESFWQLRPARCKNIGHRRLVRKHIPAKLILYASFCAFMAAWENRFQIDRRVPRRIFSFVTRCHRVAFFGSFLSVVASSPFLSKPVIFQLTLGTTCHTSFGWNLHN